MLTARGTLGRQPRDRRAGGGDPYNGGAVQHRREVALNDARELELVQARPFFRGFLVVIVLLVAVEQFDGSLACALLLFSI